MPFLELLPTLIKPEEIPAYLAAGAKAVGIGGQGMTDVEALAREAVRQRGG